MTTDTAKYLINRSEFTLTGPFTEADIELAKLAFKAVLVEFDKA